MNISLSPPLVLDIIMLAVLLLVALGYARRGFLAGIIQFAGNVVSLVGSVILAQKGAPLVFETFLRASYTARVEKTILESGSVDLKALADQYAGFLPESFREELLEKTSELASELAASAAPELAQRIVEELLMPLTTPMIAIVLFFVCFALFRLVLGLLVSLLQGANHIPLLGGVNRSMGFCLGLLAGAVDVYILLCILFALMTLTSGQLPYLNGADLAGSWCLRLFGHINPFL